MFNTSPSKYLLKSTISEQAGKTPLKYLNSDIKWHDLTLRFAATAHLPSEGKAKVCSFQNYPFSREASRCDFPLATGAVCAGQSGAVSSTRLRAIPVLKEECPYGTYGMECRKTCNCPSGICDRVTGKCLKFPFFQLSASKPPNRRKIISHTENDMASGDGNSVKEEFVKEKAIRSPVMKWLNPR
nr:endothelial cell-specific molecule 1 isoform X2 [Anser cygnoides]